MDAQQFFLDIFSFVQTMFGMILGVIVLQLVIFLFLARLLEESKNPFEEGGAIFSYIMLTVGAILMSISAIPATISILGGVTPFSAEIYFGLVLIFAVGGLLYLWNDHRLRETSDKAKRVPRVIFFYTVKGMGQLSLVLAGLYLVLSIVLQQGETGEIWGVPLTLAIYGGVLCILTEEPKKKHLSLLPKKKKAVRKKKK